MRDHADELDLVVIGAGIIGSRVALEAARAGLKVALVERSDFGSGTSQASSKLIHGGLRYLPMGDIGLVRENHLERRALLDSVACNLVWPLDFLVPIYNGVLAAAELWAGLVVYSGLSGFRHSRNGLIGPKRARGLVPDLKPEGLTACGVLQDAQTNDSRLVLATVTAASRLGVEVANGAAVVGIEKGAVHVEDAAGSRTILCRQVVNAAGPWVDRVRRLEDPDCAPGSRLSKGVHVTLPMPKGWHAAIARSVGGSRVAFALPWEGVLLIGTTDTPYEGEPEDARVEDADLDQVFHEASLSLPAEVLDRTQILYAMAGLRVLELGSSTTAETSREHVITKGALGMVSVAGGKLTTHRRIAMDVLHRLDDERARKHTLDNSPLPGAGPLPSRPADVDPEVWDNLVRHYGSETTKLLAYREAHDDALERIHPDAPVVWAQVYHGVAAEWARSEDDIVRRRTTLAVRGLATDAVREKISSRLRALSGTGR
ncbi:MAG TPA: glycerol-3-phosphate dehydrogenase/oxidase [Candidatus Dormibacteraeota bacterium]|nr:glycerol-3-phosphate dehydrogenase/oxidase [Candidatus Dormibacteraeota bacterium]